MARCMKGMRLRTSFVVSFLVVLAIPFLSTVIMYTSAYNKLEKEVLQSNNERLGEFFYVLEERLCAASDLLRLMSLNLFLQDLVNSDEKNLSVKPYDLYKTHQELLSFNYQYANDVFLLLKNSEKIVSAYNSVLSPQYYYSSYLSAGNDFTGWYHSISDITNEQVIPYRTDEDSMTIALCSPMTSISYKNKNAILVCVLDEDSLLELMNTYSAQSGGALLIYDNTGGLITATDKSCDAFGQSAAGADIRVDINGKRYIANVRTSAFSGLHYVSAVPQTTIHDALTQFRYLSLINIASFFIFGLLMTYFLTKRNYDPVRKLTLSVSRAFPSWTDDNGASGKYVNEYTYIEHAFERAMKEMDSSIAAARKAYLLDLLNDTRSLDPQTAERIGILPAANSFLVALISINGWDGNAFHSGYTADPPEKNGTSAGNLLTNLCRENQSDKERKYVVAMSGNLFACIWCFSDERDGCYEEAVHFFEKLKDTLSQELGCRICAALSLVCRDVHGIAAAYRQAQHAMEYRQVWGSGKLLLYADIQDVEKGGLLVFHANETYPRCAREILREFLHDEEMDAENVAKNLLKVYTGRQPLTPEAVREFVFLTISALEKDGGADSSLRLAHEDGIDIFLSKLAYSLYVWKKAKVNSMSQASQTGYGRKIATFVEENYSDDTLGVNTIAYQFNLSPSYCSKIFRNEMGKRIGDYLSEVRAEVAIHLLVETNEPIEKIAEATGFSSASVFIRVFKKQVGVTPGSYRKSWEF